MKGKIYVMDASGFIANLEVTDGPMVTVPGVADEIIDNISRIRFDILCDKGLRVEPPQKKFGDQVRSAAAATGDITVLSGTDLDVLAKALELEGAYQVILITDDYAVQNVADYLGILYRSAATPGISTAIKWELRCTGCHAAVDSGELCPICGSKVRRCRVGR